MKISVERPKDSKDADDSILFKFYKEENDKNFYLNMYRILQDKSLDFMAWVIYNISDGYLIEAQKYTPQKSEEIIKEYEDLQHKRRYANEMSCILFFIMGTVLVATPLYNTPEYPLTVFFMIIGTIIMLLSVIIYIFLEKEEKITNLYIP